MPIIGHVHRHKNILVVVVFLLGVLFGIFIASDSPIITVLSVPKKKTAFFTTPSGEDGQRKFRLPVEPAAMNSTTGRVFQDRQIRTFEDKRLADFKNSKGQNQNQFTVLKRQETNQSENADVHLSTLNGTNVKEKPNQTENRFGNISAVGAAEYSGIVGIEEEGCQRRCHPDWAHRNIIIYDNSQGGAGLKDRLAILSFLALLAGHLCAVVYFPPPYNLLSKFHNGGKFVDKNLTWSDLQNIRFVDDGSPVVKGYDVHNHPDGKPYKLSEYLTGLEYDDWLRTSLNHNPNRTQLNNQFLRQAKRMEKFTSQQTQRTDPGFIWEINPVFFNFQVGFDEWQQEHIEKPGCKIFQVDPDISYRLKEKLMDELKEQNPYTTHFLLLHIRRGDATLICDTSLESMQAYLSCSFNQTKTYGNFTVLLSSDERDVSYRNKIRSMLVEGDDGEKLAHSFVDLDAAASKIVDDYTKSVVGGERLLNNYVNYKMNMLMLYDDRQIPMKLQKNRSNCPKCFSIHQAFRRAQEGKKVAKWKPLWWGPE